MYKIISSGWRPHSSSLLHLLLISDRHRSAGGTRRSSLHRIKNHWAVVGFKPYYETALYQTTVVWTSLTVFSSLCFYSIQYNKTHTHTQRHQSRWWERPSRHHYFPVDCNDDKQELGATLSSNSCLIAFTSVKGAWMLWFMLLGGVFQPATQLISSSFQGARWCSPVSAERAALFRTDGGMNRKQTARLTHGLE